MDLHRLVSLQVEQEAPRTAAAKAHGFKLVREQFVAEYDSLVLMYRHEKTGAGPRLPLLLPVQYPTTDVVAAAPGVCIAQAASQVMLAAGPKAGLHAAGPPCEVRLIWQ